MSTAAPRQSDYGPRLSGGEAVSKYWKIDEIRPAFIHAKMPDMPGMPASQFDVDEKGRQKLPAFLLTAHKAS